MTIDRLENFRTMSLMRTDCPDKVKGSDVLKSALKFEGIDACQLMRIEVDDFDYRLRKGGSVGYGRHHQWHPRAIRARANK